MIYWRVSWILRDGTAHCLEFELSGDADRCWEIVQGIETCFCCLATFEGPA